MSPWPSFFQIFRRRRPATFAVESILCYADGRRERTRKSCSVRGEYVVVREEIHDDGRHDARVVGAGPSLMKARRFVPLDATTRIPKDQYDNASLIETWF